VAILEDRPEEEQEYRVDGDEVDLCRRDPGYAVDLQVATDLRTMTAVWRGDQRYAEGLRREDVRVRGPERLRRSSPKWLGLSLLAGVERAEVG